MPDADSAAPTTARSASRMPMFLLFAGGLGISMAAIFVRLSEVGPSATAFWRLALAWPFFLSWLTFRERPHADGSRERKSAREILMLTLPGLFFACDLSVWHWSINLTSVANATLFTNCAPIPVAFIAWIWLRERLSPVFLVGLICALAGAFLVVGSSFEAGAQNVRGDALGLVTALFYGSYIVSMKIARGRFSTARIMSWSIPTACAVLLVIALVSGEQIVATSVTGWAVLVGLSLCCQIGGQGLIVYALAHLPASLSSVSLLIQPIGATFFAWLILHESLGPMQAAGGALVIAGIYLARRGTHLE